MPSHPDRVRRNYHSIIVKEYNDLKNDDLCILIKVTKAFIASRMTRAEIRRAVFSLIDKGIMKWKEK